MANISKHAMTAVFETTPTLRTQVAESLRAHLAEEMSTDTPTLDAIRLKTTDALIAESKRDPTGHRFVMLSRLDNQLFERKVALLEAKALALFIHP